MELKEQQCKIYTLLDNKIELENIQDALRNKCDNIEAFTEILEVMQENRITEIIKEEKLLEQLKATLDVTLIRQIKKINEEYLKIIQIS